ncbi:MAG: hypothetical protein M3Y13_06675 [Armatimonadota bacterium]|nr:hypothetical protein [Armatimonadota bacterium]
MRPDGNPFEAWLAEVVSDVLVVDVSAQGLEREATGNLWTFSLSQSQARALSIGDVLAFLFTIEQARERQIWERSGAANPMVLYCWFDEQAGQLRLSLVSACHSRLPFGAKIEETEDLARVVGQFLNSLYLDGIPPDEFAAQDFNGGSAGGGDGQAILLVWTKTLPTVEHHGQTSSVF